MADAQLVADLPDIEGARPVGEARGPCDDGQTRYPGERRNDVLDEAVSEGILLGVATEIGERQYRKRGRCWDRHDRTKRRGIARCGLDRLNEAISPSRDGGQGRGAQHLPQRRDMD